jgi:hypothetical protein
MQRYHRFYPIVMVGFAVQFGFPEWATGQVRQQVPTGFEGRLGGTTPTPDAQFPEFFSVPLEDMLETTSRYVTESTPVYDRQGNLCPVQSSAAGPGCEAYYTCTVQDSRGNCTHWMPTRIVCRVCPMLPPPLPDPPGYEQRLRECLANADDKLTACNRRAYEEEVVCRNTAQEKASDYCQDPRHRIILSPRAGVAIKLDVEQCIARQVGDRLGFADPSIGFQVGPQSPLGLGPSVRITLSGPNSKCADTRKAGEAMCEGLFQTHRDNCDTCQMLTCQPPPVEPSPR